MLETNVQIGDKCQLMGAYWKKDEFENTQKPILALKSFCKILFIRFEMNVPILDKMPAHGRSFER